MTIIENPSPDRWIALLKRPVKDFKDIEPLIETIFDDIKNHGDKALSAYTKRFDGVDLQEFRVPKYDIDAAEHVLPQQFKDALKFAKENITKFHESQKTQPVYVATQPGVLCWQEKRPIERVGLYIPGGSAPLFSTLLMLAIPAKIAGCQSIVLCSPPNKEGKLAPEMLYAAKLCGVTDLFKVGGVQAVAAMALGTPTIARVDKIFGPGNQYVTAAKQVAMKHCTAIDMPAGPSEVLIVADETGIPEFIASDLLAQAEHGADSQVIFVSTSKANALNVLAELEKQLEELPRKDIARQAMANSKCIVVDDNAKALDIVNAYAPEHLIICVADEDYYIKGLKHAGSVFIGNYTPESAGDYASGTNHTLPTNGYARSYSGVNLDSFTKAMTFQKITKEGLAKIGTAIEIMAQAEGLQAHKNAVSLRLKN